MQVTATEAKNRFGYVCAQAKTEPVFVEKDGRVDSVIVSVEQFEALKAAGEKKSMARRQKEFNETYGEWIALQNEHFEKQGLWCDGLVPWMEKS
ncbi:MAG: type II toxin-antitoxin system prevent-host-death family antitoxin [Polaromonas sp.]|nr:type II toxin-antitoxin system prevent-host-death family antitoxin [Polaromonas sp.]